MFSNKARMDGFQKTKLKKNKIFTRNNEMDRSFQTYVAEDEMCLRNGKVEKI